ncbi:MAG: M14 family zinc carboxypeptidase, partial [Nocardioidaceae bacterium]
MTGGVETTGLSADLRERILAVPEFDEFPSVDDLDRMARELAEAHPDVVRRERVGTSRLGEPIHALIVAGGDESAIVFGGVHPNEPIGGLTSLHLVRALCEDPQLRSDLGLTWHVIPCIDPDGTRLNEGWFAGPFTRSHYGRHFYRPPAEEQVEWTFPFSYKQAYFDRVLPETLALMRLIDATKPAFMCSLHNGELGGVYYYLSRPMPGVYGPLQAIPEMLGLPLDRGEPEVPFVQELGDAIYGMIRSEEAYDFNERMGLDPTRDGGSSSAAYAEKYGTLTLV